MPLLPPEQQLLAELKAEYFRLRKNPAAYGVELCKLCLRPSINVGLFVPRPGTDLAEWIGTPRGKLRGIPYGMCEKCFSLGADEWNKRLEQQMREECNPAVRRQAHTKHAVDFDIPALDPPQEAHTHPAPDGTANKSRKTAQNPFVPQPLPNPKQFTEAIAMISENRREFGMEHCKLCRRRAESVCMFWPAKGTDIAERIGLPAGKTRAIPYALCRRCLSLPSEERMLRVELSIRQGLGITCSSELPEL